MAQRELIIEAETVEQAIEEGLQRLGKERENTDIEILQDASSGLFNQDKTMARVKLAADARDLLELMRNLLENILSLMGVDDFTVDVEVKPEHYYGMIHSSSHLRFIIGKRGETLNAIQRIVEQILNRYSDDRVEVFLDAGNYRQRRHQNLLNLAEKSSRKAREENREVELDPMVAYERKLIHETVDDLPDVKSRSVGEDANRRVVILPRGST